MAISDSTSGSLITDNIWSNGTSGETITTTSGPFATQHFPSVPTPKVYSTEYLVHCIQQGLHTSNPELFEVAFNRVICEREGHVAEGKRCSRCDQKIAKLVADEIK